MANTKKAVSSTGKKSTKTPTLASERGKAAKRSVPAQTKKENASGLEALAELLSLIQEDVRRYSEALVFHKALIKSVDGHIIIVLPGPVGHELDTGNSHILLNGKPVTGWEE